MTHAMQFFHLFLLPARYRWSSGCGGGAFMDWCEGPPAFEAVRTFGLYLGSVSFLTGILYVAVKLSTARPATALSGTPLAALGLATCVSAYWFTNGADAAIMLLTIFAFYISARTIPTPKDTHEN